MADQQFANFATSLVANVGGITSGATSVDCSAGEGNGLFPALSGNQYYYMTFVDSSGNREVVKVTARSGDTMTIVRGQQGTAARAWSQSDIIDMRLTKAVFTDIMTEYELYTQKLFNRARFVYNGESTAYTIKAAPAAYWCKDKFAYWAADLTTAAIGSPAASTWYYLYIDYSAITNRTALTDGTTELVWSSTAPTWNDTYQAYMNGDDRCIFAARTNSTPNNIFDFTHSGDTVWYGTYINDYDYMDPGELFTTSVSITIPGFAREGIVCFRLDYDSTNSVGLRWRDPDSSTSEGHVVALVTSSAPRLYNTVKVVTGSTQLIDIKITGATGNVSIYTEGWCFPVGM